MKILFLDVDQKKKDFYNDIALSDFVFHWNKNNRLNVLKDRFQVFEYLKDRNDSISLEQTILCSLESHKSRLKAIDAMKLLGIKIDFINE